MGLEVICYYIMCTLFVHYVLGALVHNSGTPFLPSWIYVGYINIMYSCHPCFCSQQSAVAAIIMFFFRVVLCFVFWGKAQQM